MERMIVTAGATAPYDVKAIEPDADVWAGLDPLTSGPLPDLHDLPAFYAARADWWAEIQAGLEEADPYAMWRHLPKSECAAPDIVAAVKRATRIELWISDDAASQALGLWLNALLALHDVPLSRSFCLYLAGGKRLKGLNGLRREDYPTERHAEPMTKVESAHWRGLWNAFRAERVASPDLPDRFGAAFAARRGFLRDPTTGFSQVELELVRACRPRFQKVARVIADVWIPMLERGEEVGDLVLRKIIEDLAARPDPPVEIAGSVKLIRRSEVRLTSRGATLKARLA